MRRSLLGLGAEEEAPPPERDAIAPGHSLLGLDRPAGEPGRVRAVPPRVSSEAAPRDPAEEPEEEIFHLDRTGERAFPIERAILFSLAAHVLFVFVLLFGGRWWQPGDARRGLLGAFVPAEPTAADKIPIVFRSAPGPARESSKSAVASDANRRAGGGDRSKPKADTPFVPPRPGIEGLAEGRRAAASAPRVPAPAVARGQRGATALEKPGTAAPAEKTAESPDAFRVPPPGASSPGREGSPTGEGSRLAGLDRAIREAAKGVEQQGENGAGFPNPDGGYMDSGPISFDTAWYNWGPYAAEMVRRIKLHWDIPELARLGWKGKLTIRFFIRGNGGVEGATILSRSGIPPFDFAALQAILKSNPFRPLPKDLGSDREGVTVTFFYNMRPDKPGEKSGE